MKNADNLNQDAENKSETAVTTAASSDSCNSESSGKIDPEGTNDDRDNLGTIAARVQLEIEPFDNSSETYVFDFISDALSQSPVPLLNLEGMKLMYVGETALGVSSCNLEEYDILLTPYPFKRQSLESFPDSRLISEIDQDVTRRLLSLTTQTGVISEVRVLSVDRKPQLSSDLAEQLNPYQYESDAFDWSTGVLPHEKFSMHALNFEDALASEKDILEDGIHDATLENVTVKKDPRKLDGWSALLTWRIEGKESAAPHLVSGCWYYPVNPESDAKFHIFHLLRPWLGNEALMSGDLDLRSLVGRKCKLVIIRIHDVELYHRRMYCSMETPIWAVLPADSQVK